MRSVLATEKGSQYTSHWSLLNARWSFLLSSVGNQHLPTGYMAISRGMVANKGTDSGDQPDINPSQTFSESATNPYLNVKWREVYEAVSRCNNALSVTAKAATKQVTITADQADSFTRQARALRGWYHFEAWRMWEKIPYVDETTDPSYLPTLKMLSRKFLLTLRKV